MTLRLKTPRVPPLPLNEIDAEILERLGVAPSSTSFRTLAQHPKLMKRWLVFGSHILGRSSLPPREREILILRIGWLCRSAYEWGQHVRIGLGSGLSRRRSIAFRWAPTLPAPRGPISSALCCAPPTSCTPMPSSATRPGQRSPSTSTCTSSWTWSSRSVSTTWFRWRSTRSACSPSRTCRRSRLPRRASRANPASSGRAGSARWSSCRARARAPRPRPAPGRSGPRAACRAPRPTGRRRRCPRWRPA